MPTSIDVLVVDDSDFHADMTLLAIRRALPEASVVRLKDGDQALQFMHCTGGFSGRPPDMPRLILLELQIPFVNGLQVIDGLQGSSRTKEIPVVVLTSSQNPVAVESSYALGASEYIVKPAAFDKCCAEIEGIIERWLPKEQSLPPEMGDHDSNHTSA